MDMHDACAEVLAEVDGSLGCIVIDMQRGITVAAEYRQGSVMNPATVNLVAVLSTNMFQGKLIRQFEGALSRPSASGGDFVREVQMATEHTHQFMAAIPGWENTLLVLVTDKTVSVGLGWMAVHRLISRFGDATLQPGAAQPAPQPAPQPVPRPLERPAAASAATFASPQQRPPVPPSEPFPDAHRYAPPAPPTHTISAGPASTQPPSRRYRGAPVQPQEPAEAEPPAEPKAKKKPIALGPRVSMFRRK